MQRKKESFAGLSATIFLPNGYKNEKKRYPVYYFSDGQVLDRPGMADAIFAVYPDEFIAVGVLSQDRDREFTPWPTENVFKGLPPFSGGAKEHLAKLIRFKEELDRQYRTLPDACNTALLGYSLGGLFSVYSLYNTEVFGHFATLSGSMWYPDFIAYCASHTPKNLEASLYASLGNCEPENDHPQFSRVGICTDAVVAIAKTQLERDRVLFEENYGEHNDGMPLRYQKALSFIHRQVCPEEPSNINVAGKELPSIKAGE